MRRLPCTGHNRTRENRFHATVELTRAIRLAGYRVIEKQKLRSEPDHFAELLADTMDKGEVGKEENKQCP